MKCYILTFSSFLFFCLPATSQFEFVESLGTSHPANFSTVSENDEYALIALNGNMLFSINKSTSEVTQVEHPIPNNTILYPSDEGVFFNQKITTSGIENSKMIHVSLQGDVFISNPIIFENTNGELPSITAKPVVHQDWFYSVGWNANVYSIWKSNGTQEGTESIFQTDNEILGFFTFNDALVAVTKSATEYLFFKKMDGDSFEEFYHVPITTFTPYFGTIGADDSNFYFNTNVGVGHYQVWKSDLTALGTTLFLDSTNAQSIKINNTHALVEQGYWATVFKRYPLNSLDSPERVPLATGVVQPSSVAIQNFGNDYYGYMSIEEGYELVKLNDDFEFEIVFDNNPKSLSSIPVNIDGYNELYFTRYPSCTDGQGNLFTVLRTTENDESFIYKITEDEIMPLFKWNMEYDIIHMFTSPEWLYIVRKNGQECTLERRSLTESDLVSEPLEVSTEKWFTQLAWAWERNVNSSSSTEVLLSDVILDKENNIYIVFDSRLSPSWYLFTQDTVVPETIKGKIIAAKFNGAGKLIWVNSIGPTGIYLTYNGVKCTLQSTGDLIISSSTNTGGTFDNTVWSSNTKALYMCSLSGEDGHVKWVNKVMPGNQTRLPDALKVFKNDEITLAFGYDDFETEVGDIDLTSDRSPVNALAIFDSTGNVLSAFTAPTPWTDKYGRTFFMDTLANSNSIAMIQSQGHYNVWSSCEFSDWRFHYQVIGETGVDASQPIGQCNDLSGLTCATSIGDNKIFGAGFFRGDSLQFGLNYIASSLETESCWKNGFYSMIYDQQKQSVTQLTVAIDTAFYPLDIDFVNEEIYVYGVKKNYDLGIAKFDKKGSFVGYKSIGQRATPFDGEFQQRFAVNEESIVVIGNNFSRDTALGVIPEINFAPSVSILKTPNDGWVYSPDWFVKVPFHYLETYTADFHIYPNPFNGEVTIVLDPALGECEGYEIYDLQGRIVQTGSIRDTFIHTVSLEHLARGAYVIRMAFADAIINKKIVRN